MLTLLPQQMVNRALSFAMSEPRGPVYLCGAREVMEEDLEPYQLDKAYWSPVEPAALAPTSVKVIAEALVNAQEPLLITGYSGRNHAAVEELVQLANTVKGLRVLDTGGSDMCFPGEQNHCESRQSSIRAIQSRNHNKLILNSKPPGLARSPLRR